MTLSAHSSITPISTVIFREEGKEVMTFKINIGVNLKEMNKVWPKIKRQRNSNTDIHLQILRRFQSKSPVSRAGYHPCGKAGALALGEIQSLP